MGIDRDTLYPLVHSEDRLLNRSFDYQEEGYRIPLKTHRIWLTSPNNPREMLSVLTDTFLQEQMLSTNQVLDDAAQRDRIGNKWTHYFWTNDRTLIPRTVQQMEEWGFIVRELH